SSDVHAAHNLDQIEKIDEMSDAVGLTCSPRRMSRCHATAIDARDGVSTGLGSAAAIPRAACAAESPGQVPASQSSAPYTGTMIRTHTQQMRTSCPRLRPTIA